MTASHPKIETALGEASQARLRAKSLESASTFILLLAILLLAATGIQALGRPVVKQTWCDYQCRPARGMYTAPAMGEDSGHCDCFQQQESE
jgi:hypothetical protein